MTFRFGERGIVVMKRRKGLVFLFVFVMMSLYASAIYANDTKEAVKGVNVQVVTEEKDGNSIDYLVSEDDYVKIARNNSSLKVANTTFEGKQLLIGNVNKGTEITIAIYNKTANKEEYSEEASNTYTIKVDTSEGFEQLIELLEGDNKIKITYVNKADKKEDVMVFYIKRESAENKKAIESFVVKANL